MLHNIETRGYQGMSDDCDNNPLSSSRRRNLLQRPLLLALVVLLPISVPVLIYALSSRPVENKSWVESSAKTFSRCQGIDWQQACEQILNSSSTRRHLVSEDYSQYLTYDANCLLVYRMELEANITFPYYSNQFVQAGGNQTMVVFIQHGALRDADYSYCSFQQLMLEQTYRPFDQILVIAPDFNFKNDEGVLSTDAFWNSTKPWGDWRIGAESDPECCGNSNANSTSTISSFEVLDQMFGVLTNTQLYPNIDKISFVGHSAGGQMVHRYAMLSQLAAKYDAGKGTADLEFIVANPSSYVYLTDYRYKYNCGNCECSSEKCVCDQNCTQPAGLTVPDESGVCMDNKYNDWPYGLGMFSDGSQYSIPYAIRAPCNTARIYRERSVTYLVGQNDTCNTDLPTCSPDCWKREEYLPDERPCYSHQIDTRCPAMLEGPNRRDRGILYMQHLEFVYGEKTHVFHVIPDAGHNATAMFGSSIGLQELFD